MQGTVAASQQSGVHVQDHAESEFVQQRFCSLCDVRTTSDGDMAFHLGGRRHQSMLETVQSEQLSPE